MPVQTRERGGTENKLIQAVRVLIFRAHNPLPLVAASLYSAAKKLNVLQSHGQHGRVYAEWGCQIDQSFHLRPKAAAVIKSGLDHVAVIPRSNRKQGDLGKYWDGSTGAFFPSCSCCTRSFFFADFLPTSPFFYSLSLFLYQLGQPFSHFWLDDHMHEPRGGFTIVIPQRERERVTVIHNCYYLFPGWK